MKARLLLWLLIALPAVLIEGYYVSGALTYGQVLHVTGETSARLLILTLAVTPLRMMFPRQGWTVWMLRHRREFGLGAFGYAVFHAAVYLVRKAPLGVLVAEGRQPELLTGWLALLVFVPLALTSNDISVRALGPRWKALHRLVYLAAVLSLAHWLWEAFEPVPALVQGGVLAALEAVRIALSRRRATSA